MNDTTTASEAPEDRGFDPQRVRTLTDMRRSRDDRMVAGVCTGVARHLDIDPVIVRVVIAALTFVGLAGPILYLAAWFLVPSDDAERSIAADWFNLDEQEERVRTVGLIGAAAVAAISVVSDGSWGGGPPGEVLFWVVVPTAILYWFFAVLPRRRREARGLATTASSPTTATTAATAVDGAPPSGIESTAVIPTGSPRPRRPRRSPALAWLTLSVVAVVLGALGMWDAAHASADVTWLTYIATALGIVGLGLVVGSVVGHGLWLVPLGILLAVVLAIGSVVPSGKIGEDHHAPLTASQVRSEYRLGIGDFRLDLRDVADPDQLVGRTISVDQGIGSLEVIVPEGTPVTVRSHVRGGDIEVFGRQESGTDRRLDTVGIRSRSLTIEADMGLGQIKVVDQ
ncbi:hypothetical protein ASD11_12155 [Aeromicrobium sp. Root495]|uniref:PspC domain-containing protein n=1 Tax=Aeromicrobium sp. Root495 TaxID=1736550 RepID=UPI000700572E|nr:PspC domain-containing protein [Aeromicrobium sp. Root495]KQY60215.1 hypothetical protein ASD11_12155 [Aeromicrobium sp. Root495]